MHGWSSENEHQNFDVSDKELIPIATWNTEYTDIPRPKNRSRTKSDNLYDDNQYALNFKNSDEKPQ